MSECLLCGGEPEEDEPVYLALVLRRKDGIRIEASVGVFFQGGNYSADLRRQVTHHIIRRIAFWNLTIILVDICYNVMPALKDAHGDAQPFLSLNLLWVLTSVAGVGGVCVWAYLKSFPTTKLIPIRDPRIVESLTHHE